MVCYPELSSCCRLLHVTQTKILCCLDSVPPWYSCHLVHVFILHSVTGRTGHYLGGCASPVASKMSRIHLFKRPLLQDSLPRFGSEKGFVYCHIGFSSAMINDPKEPPASYMYHGFNWAWLICHTSLVHLWLIIQWTHCHYLPRFQQIRGVSGHIWKLRPRDRERRKPKPGLDMKSGRGISILLMV